MTDDSSWSADPRRSADHGVSARHVRTIDLVSARGRRSLSEIDFDPEPTRRGTRRFADPEPEQWHELDRSPLDDPGAPYIGNRRYQETSYPLLREVTRPRPRPEPASDFWSVTGVRSRASAAEVEPKLPKRTIPEPVLTPSSPFSSEPADENAGNEEETVSARVVRPDFLGRLKRIDLVILAGTLTLTLGFTAWSWITRGTWEFTSLWPLGVSTSPEKLGSSTLAPSVSPDPEGTAGARPAASEQALDDIHSMVPIGWKEYGENQSSAEPNRKMVCP